MKELDSFTVEQLNDFIKSDHAQCGDVAALARIALAAKRAEPVAWVVGDEEIADFKNGREVCVMRDCDDEQLDYLPLYTTPQLNSPEIPEGWKLVPNMPTLGMLSVLGLTGSFESMLGRYADMLAAAPESE